MRQRRRPQKLLVRVALVLLCMKSWAAAAFVPVDTRKLSLADRPFISVADTLSVRQIPYRAVIVDSSRTDGQVRTIPNSQYRKALRPFGWLYDGDTLFVNVTAPPIDSVRALSQRGERSASLLLAALADVRPTQVSSPPRTDTPPGPGTGSSHLSEFVIPSLWMLVGLLGIVFLALLVGWFIIYHLLMRRLEKLLEASRPSGSGASAPEGSPTGPAQRPVESQELTALSARVARVERGLGSAVVDIDESTRRVEMLVADALRRAGPSAADEDARLPLEQAYNRARFSRDPELQRLFISSRRAARAKSSGARAERGVAAQAGDEFRLEKHEAGRFLVVEEGGEFSILPDFDIEFTSPHFASAFNAEGVDRLSPANWELLTPAKATSVQGGEWRLASPGVIRPRVSVNEQLAHVEENAAQLATKLASLEAEVRALATAKGKTASQLAADAAASVPRALFDNMEFISRLEKAVKEKVGKVAKEEIAAAIGRTRGGLETSLLEVVLYNEASRASKSKQLEFSRVRHGVAVEAERDGSAVTLRASSDGNLMLIERPETGNEAVVFPGFGAAPLDVTVAFDVGPSPSDDWDVARPAVATRRPDKGWDLVARGEITNK